MRRGAGGRSILNIMPPYFEISKRGATADGIPRTGLLGRYLDAVRARSAPGDSQPGDASDACSEQCQRAWLGRCRDRSWPQEPNLVEASEVFAIQLISENAHET